MSETSFLAELKRRNVLRAAVLYIGAVWALAQGIAQLGPSVGAPEWVTRWFLVACGIAFPFWLAFAWFYQFTPEGLKKESEIDPARSITAHTGRKLDRWIFAVMGLAIVLLLTNTFVWKKGAGLGDAPPLAAPEESIAVLPFVDMSQAKDQEYFSDGISEELLNLLAKIPELQVTARTSSFAFKGKELGIAEIARTLKVAHVLEGSVRKSGDQVRITAQLINAGTDKHLWSQTYDRKLDDIFKVQDEIAADVVKALEVKLLGAAPRTRATSPEAYALYLQAVEVARQVTAEAFAKSDALLERALEIDPTYAPAWNELARNSINKSSYGVILYEQAAAAARKQVMQALAVDPDYGPAHARLGSMEMYSGATLALAVPHLQRAFELAPGDSSVLSIAANLLQALGRVDEAVALRTELIRRDPVNQTLLFSQANALRMLGRFDEAIDMLGTLLGLAPDRSAVRANLGLTLVLKGNAQEGLAQIERDKSEIWRSQFLPIAYHALGRKQEADAASAALVRWEKDWSYNIACVYAFRGDADKAFEWLDRAVLNRDSGLVDVAAEPLFALIRPDPRWLPFLRKVGQAPEQLAAIEFKVPMPK